MNTQERWTVKAMTFGYAIFVVNADGSLGRQVAALEVEFPEGLDQAVADAARILGVSVDEAWGMIKGG